MTPSWEGGLGVRPLGRTDGGDEGGRDNLNTFYSCMKLPKNK